MRLRPTGAASLAKLASGAVNLAIVSEPDVLVARARGDQVVSIGTLEQGPLEAVISIPPSTVTKIAGLTGKTVAIGATPATGGGPLARAELETMLQSAGVAAAGVHTIDAGPNPIAAVKANKADAALGGQWPVQVVALELNAASRT